MPSDFCVEQDNITNPQIIINALVFICIFIKLANPKNVMVKRVKFHLRASEAG